MMHRLLTSATGLVDLILDQQLGNSSTSYYNSWQLVFSKISLQKLIKDNTKWLLINCISFVIFSANQEALSQCPTITAMSTTAMNCADGTEDFLISPSIFPIDQGDYTYQWTGPNGYTFTDSVAILMNGTSLNNGTYTLIVSNGICNSDPVNIIIDIIDKPVTPQIEKGDSLCVGDQLELLIANSAIYSGVTIEYQWITPTGIINTATPDLTLNITNAANSGKYSVLIIVDGCVSDLSSEVNVLLSDFPTRPVAEIVAPVCIGDSIQLNTTEVPEANYEWIGPNDFVANSSNPLIRDANFNHQGEYRVRIVMQQCASDYSLPITVNINSLPSIPVAENNGPLCIGKGNNTLELSVSDLTYVAGQSYTWIDSISGNVVAGPLTTQTVSINDFSNYTDGDWDFQVVTSLNACNSAKSESTTVSLNFIPTEQARAGEDKRICNADTVMLAANEAIIGIGEWKNITSLSADIENPNSASTKIGNLKSDTIYQFEWSLENGVCGVFDADTLLVFVNDENIIAVADTLLELCDSTSIELSAIASTGNTFGFWTQDIQQANNGIVIVEADNNNTNITNLTSANDYTFFWTLSNEACGNYSTAVTKVIISDSDFQVSAGDEQKICGEPRGMISAQNENGTWTSLNIETTIEKPDEATTLVNGLQVGSNTFVWMVENGACGSVSDETTIFYDRAPILVDDNYELKFIPELEMLVTENDDLPISFDVSIHTQPERGTATLFNNVFTYKPDSDFKGIDQFFYQVCNTTCSNTCELALVTIDVDNLFPCTMPTIFTPNNDGVNDELRIPCLTTGNRFPNNSISIFNQWGDEIFRASPYLNDWRGTFNGKDLPSGTYYYILDKGDDSKLETRFLVLER